LRSPLRVGWVEQAAEHLPGRCQGLRLVEQLGDHPGVCHAVGVGGAGAGVEVYGGQQQSAIMPQASPPAAMPASTTVVAGSKRQTSSWTSTTIG
jgi:hypothetical protein